MSCTDPLTLAQEYCAGEHLLLSITPTAYQNNTGHALHPFVFGYTGLRTNTYYDSSEKVGTNHYQAQNSWQYLNFFIDLTTGIGESVSWQIAYSNTDGTPDDLTSQGTVDGRYDPLHCATWNDCTGHYAHPDNQSWSEWVVTQISALGTDSSATALTPAATTYAYVLAKTGTYSGKVYCYPSANNVDKDCVGDNWIPKGNTDWQDYYHAEYQGFAQVWIVSPSQDLTLDQYHSTEGWYTPWSDYQNFEGGSLYLEDRYSGNSLNLTTLPLLSSLYNTYADNANACRSASATYPACEIVLTPTTSIEYNQTQHENPVSVEHSYAYDDYTAS
ncbi:MAG TPA: hypothetical protein VGT44_01235, partial [Ktedonobacteraceae bacterium]|nr:hypothetical protein [Ktedonobacteraceae bacterium]